MDTLSPFKRVMFKSMFKLMQLSGKAHKLEVGAKRYVDGLRDASYKSGRFYASRNGVTGPIIDQSTLFDSLENPAIQDNANEAIHRYLN